MLDDVSPAVERAFESARRRATDGALNAIHLFLALIEDDEGRAAQLLVESGGNLTAIRETLQVDQPAPLDLPSVMSGAREVAGERAESTITGEFLLLGLVRSVTKLREPLLRAGVAVDQLASPTELPPLAVAEALDIRDTVDVLAAGRIIDANANRAREALRVLDDYCRFILDDATLTEELKSLRHQLAVQLARLPESLLHESRDTVGDVGTEVTTAGEMVRGATADVARINFKRLTEALRSLEEYGKIVAPEMAAGIESIRYRAYTIERATTIGSSARDALANANLYVLLTGSQCLASLDWTIAEAAAGGATIFQLREKTLSDRELLERARNVRRWTRQAGALFIMNDRPDIARLAEADGVHLGQDDMTVAEARKIMGHGPLIGVSTHTPAHVRQAIIDGASYIGIGPTFPSRTKQFEELAGLEFIRQATAITSLPAFAIGGITPENVSQSIAAGAKRVAVSAAICGTEEPRIAAAAFANALRNA